MATLARKTCWLIGRCLDSGCWVWHGGIHARVSQRGARPVGVDLPHIIQVARDGLVRVIGDTLPLVSADGRRLPFRDGSFDIVVSIGVLEHVPRPAALVEEMARVLKRGGIFMLYFGPNRRLRFAQSSSHRQTVSSYWTPEEAWRTMRAQQLSSIRMVWADIVQYRFRNNYFTFGARGLYRGFVRLFVEACQRLRLSVVVGPVCRALESLSLQRNVGLVATKR